MTDEPTPDKANSGKANSDKANSDKANSDKANSDKANSDKANSDKANSGKANSGKAAPDETTPPETLPLEARLAEYGAVLREELDDATGKVAAIAAFTTPTDATADRGLGVAQMGAGTAPAQRGKHRRTGLLVAAVLALIAGIGVFSLQDRGSDQTIQVASQPSTVPEDPSTDDEDAESDATNEGTGDETPEPVATQGASGADAAPSQPDGTTDDPDGGDPGAEDPDATPTGPPIEVICEAGTLRGNVCVIVGNPPVPGPDVCPVSATVFEDSQGCYRIIPLSPDCAGLAILDATSCRQPVELVPSPTECAPGFTPRAFDQTCTRPATSTTVCIEGILQQGQCVITGSAPGSTCPDGAGIIEEGGQCFRVEEASCGDLEPVANTNECRAQGTLVDTQICTGTPPPVAIADPVVNGLCVVTAPIAEYCDGDAVLENSECVRIEEFEEFEICPTSATVFEDATGCWEFLAFLPDGSCPQGVPTPDATQCIRAVPLDILPECFGTPVVDPVTGFDMCEFRDAALIGCGGYGYPDPTAALPGGCLRFDGPPTMGLSCVETGVAVATPAECFTTAPASCEVPGCRTPVDSIVKTSPCSAGFELGPNNTSCIRFALPVTECIDGELDLDGTSCVILGATLGGPPACPDGDDIIDAGVSCYRRIPRTGCGDLAEIDGGCRTTVALRPASLSCPQPGYGLVDDQCVRYQQPVSLAAADE